MMIFEDLPILQLLFSLSCVILQLNLLSDFPNINLFQPLFLGVVTCSIINHFLWFYHFTSVSNSYSSYSNYGSYSNYNHHYTFHQISAFFLLMIWFIPFIYFLSLSANDLTLPSFSPTNSNSNSNPNSNGGEKKKKSLIKSILEWFNQLFQFNNDKYVHLNSFDYLNNNRKLY
jgi:hypothetical protein